MTRFECSIREQRSPAWAKAVVCMAMLCLALPLGAQTTTGGGYVGEPQPAVKDGYLIPGCMIVFGSPPNPDGPDRPCITTCTGPMASDKTKATRQVCKGLPPQPPELAGREYEPFFKYFDPEGKRISPTNLPPGSTRCMTLLGPDGYPNWRSYLPKGHPRCKGVTGEPHLFNYDDVRFDLQTAGEFIAAKSLDDELEVHVRLEPWPGREDTVSVATAAAARVGPHRIMIAAKTGTPLRIDGEPVEMPEDSYRLIEDVGAAIIRTGKYYSVVWPDGTNLHVQNTVPTHLDVWLLPAEPRDGRLVGILGDGDEDGNTFRTRGGRMLDSPPDFDSLYKEFADSWRIRQEESLFDYEPGATTATFTNREMPLRETTIDDIAPEARARAERVCREAGVAYPDALKQCIFDVGLTGDERLIASALALQPSPELAADLAELGVGPKLPEPPEGVLIDAPETGIAAHDIEVGISGHSKGSWLGFVPASSGDSANSAGNPYSAVALTGEEQTVTLVVPTTPGEYELHYREAGGQRRVIERQAFQSTAPQVRIEAPSGAQAGGSLGVRVIGDVGERMTVTVVPAGSPDKELSSSFFYTTQGSEMSGSIRRLPNEPGDYEIRCRSDWGAAQVYARRPLTIR